MKYPFLHEKKPNPSPTQLEIYFSSILIQINVIAQVSGVGRDFCDMDFLQNAIKNGGNVTSVKNYFL